MAEMHAGLRFSSLSVLRNQNAHRHRFAPLIESTLIDFSHRRRRRRVN
jgi:hypothetical protein